jgi:tetratricopeptide (TPR) repeat protein
MAKKYFIIKALIKSFIDMGHYFDNIKRDIEDEKLSMDLKEKAKHFYQKYVTQKDYLLEFSIYDSLIQVYSYLATQEEKLKNYEKSIEYLYKQLDNLKDLATVAKHLKDFKDKGNEYENQGNEIYLKIANLNFKLQNYERTLHCLEEIRSVIEGNDPNANPV